MAFSLVAFDLTDKALAIGDQAIVTFTFSEAVTSFDIGDVTSNNGTISNLFTNDNINYTALFTPMVGAMVPSSALEVNFSGILGADGQAGTGLVYSPTYSIDTLRPTAMIVLADTSLNAGETTLVVFTFSEAVAGFINADLSVANGTLTEVSSADGGITWTATFTPAIGVDDASNLITLNNAGVMDEAGNTGTGTTNSNNYALQTVRPTATVVVEDDALGIADTSTVTVTFSGAVSGFNNSKLTVANGTLSVMSSTDGGVTWTAMLTPDPTVTQQSNLITLDMTGITNAAGNSGVGTVHSNPYDIDMVRPTASLVVADTALEAGETTQVTITFSEAVSGLTNADLTVENGVLAGLSTTDSGVTWTATLTPVSGVTDATNIITLNLAGVQDDAGNVGVGSASSNSYQVGYVPPPEPPSEDDVIVLPAGGGSVAAGPGDDRVTGGDSADFVQGNVGADSLFGGAGSDIVRGGQDGDFVHGNVGADQLFGDLGDDSVFGGQGDDFVQGGAGADYVVGDLGRDTVVGGQGTDNVSGGEGDDYLSGDLGDDVLTGGAGADLFNFNAGGGRDVVMDFSHADGDVIRISTGDAADFAALSAKFVADASGAVVQLGGQTIVLVGLAADSLTADHFVFG